MLAVTTLSSYLYCPRKVFIQKVLKVAPPPKDVLVIGSINHETLDLSNQAEESIIKSIKSHLPFQDIFELYKKVYYLNLKTQISTKEDQLREVNLIPDQVFEKTWPKMLSEAKLRSQNIFAFITFNRLYGDELWEKLTPKFMTEVRASSEKLGIRGIIDKIEVHNNKTFIPLELKTGSLPRFGVWPGHKIQILSYIFLLREKLNKPEINEGIVHYLDHDEKRKIITNPFSENEINALVSSVNQMIKDQELPPIQENPNKCNACNLREFCNKL